MSQRSLSTTRCEQNGGSGSRLLPGSMGFTLIEVLIALIILSVSLLALAGLMATSTGNNASGAHLTEAVTMGQDKLEELRATRWETIPEGATTDQTLGSTGTAYARQWAVATAGNLKTVTVTVTWADRINHSVQLLSLISH
jgi:prepilin-type N-terminal cleavage/methylation domain-containing protein